MMDDNDFDHIIDVPDTPDRLSARLRSHTTGKECISGCQSLLKDEVRGVDRIGPSRRPFIRPPKRITSANGSVGCSNTIILSPSDNTCNSQGHSRRIKTDQSSEHDSGCISAALYDIHHGKALRSSDASEDGAAMRRNACKALHETSSPFRASKQFGGKCRKAEGETNRDYSHHPSNSFQRLASNSGKGKEKVDESICRGNGSAMGHGKEIHLPGVSFNNNNERNLPKRSLEPHDVSSPRAVRQKKLVRNGCISPHNIATKTIHLDGENSNNLKNFGPIVLDDVSGSSQCWPEEKGLTGDGNGGRDKGKGILHPCSSRDHGARAINTSSRNPFITGTDAARPADVNVEDFNESQSGWRSTRNNTNNMVHASSTLQASHQRIGSLTGSSRMTRKDIPERTNRLCLNKSSRSDVPENMEAERATSRLAPSASTAVRRQTRNGLRSRNDVDHDSVVLLEDSPDLPSARRPNHRSNPIIEIDEFSPVVRQSGSERAGPSVPNHLDDATARQMEADEILARELQEQLYNESLSTEFVAQILHEDQNHVAPTNAVGHRRTSVNRGASTTRTRRQPQPQLRQGRSPFRGRINAAIRSQQTRGRRQTSRRPSTLARDTGPRFPSNMDLDMRIDVLEALEAALGDMDDIIEATSDIFHVQRDFNEDDYEMLLALDENVHQAGASSRQINNLPESKVQSNTMCEETCAICLENPAIGDTIRHLPCFHKFHKDCIDPWLSRSTSCPVCKSSIS